MKSYRKRLEDEHAALRSRRVALRETIAWYQRGHRVGDALDTRNRLRDLQMMLNGTQREWEQLCVALGKEHMLAGPVKLDIPARSSVSRARTAPRQIQRSASMPYLTRMLGGR